MGGDMHGTHDHRLVAAQPKPAPPGAHTPAIVALSLVQLYCLNTAVVSGLCSPPDFAWLT